MRMRKDEQSVRFVTDNGTILIQGSYGGQVTLGLSSKPKQRGALDVVVAMGQSMQKAVAAAILDVGGAELDADGG